MVLVNASKFKQNMKGVGVVCFLVAFSLVISSIQCNVHNLCLSNSEYPINYYKRFIFGIREALLPEIYYSDDDVQILRPSMPDSSRFDFMGLKVKGEKISAAIDLLDASIVAYRSGNTSYFFSNAPQAAYENLFTDTTQITMELNNTFQSLEKAAGITRSQIPLGETPFDIAISSLFHHELVPESFLVIIQMTIEASKFRFILQHVINSLRDGKVFLPSLAILSLEDNWSELSFQIQASKSLQGLFGNEVLLYNSNDEPIKVDSIHYPIVHSNLVYQLYTCYEEDYHNIIIKMPGSIKDYQTQQKDKCKVEPKTVRISGPDGLCVDVADASGADGSRVILYTCGNQVNQKWTFYQDSTIRSLGKCLATNTSRFGNSIVIYDCDNASKEDIQWNVFGNGRIKLSSDDIALTAKNATKLSNLTGEPHKYDADQKWRVGNYVKPFVVSIVGPNDMCMEATIGNPDIWLDDCVKNKKEQLWALYSDGTIRADHNRSLCVNYVYTGSSNIVTIATCNGSSKQRWSHFEGKIGNPYKLYMDVAEDEPKKIILQPAYYGYTQDWVLLY